MPSVTRLLRRLRARIRYRRFEDDLAEELEFHRAMKTREWQQRGVSPSEVRIMTRREMGNVLREHEASRAVWIAAWLDSLWQDLCYAMRSLRRQPGFTLTATAALILGIGLNTTAFTIFNGVALSPWPVSDPSSVVRVFSPRQVFPRGSSSAIGFSLAEYRYLRDHTRTFSGLVAMREGGGRLGHEAVGRTTAFSYVSGNYFNVLGVGMTLGRGFRPDEDQVGTPAAVAVIGHKLWERQFNSDRTILGRTINVDDVPFVVVGVAGPTFAGTAPTAQELWLPFSSIRLLDRDGTNAASLLEKPSQCCSGVAGRLAPGVTREQARAELEVLRGQFQAGSRDARTSILLTDTPILFQPGMSNRLIPVFGLMFAAVGLVLLLACANVGNLLLARALARQREIGIRLSLGAGRWRIVRQLLTEGLVLACLAGGVAIVIAFVLPPMLFRAAFAAQVRSTLTPDLDVLVFTLAVALVACLFSALLPALKATRASASLVLVREARTRIGTRLRSLLLAGQVAVSVVLLISAALLVRGVQHARTQDPGFHIDDVTVASVSFPRMAYDEARSRAFVSDLLIALRGDPELSRVGSTAIVPLGMSRSMIGFRRPGEGESDTTAVQIEDVSAGYFDVLGIPFVAGRNFEPADRTRQAIVINEAMARRYFRDVNPIGQAIVTGGGASTRTREIVGVVRDASTSGLGQISPMIFAPHEGGLSTHLLFRASSEATTARLKAAIASVDPRVLLDVTPLATYRDRWLAPSRVMAATAAAIGLLALVLASVGVFGVFSYVVQERTREIGIRMAVGARAAQVVRLVLGSTAWATLGGLVGGVAASLVVSRVLEDFLYGASAIDPLAYGGLAIVLMLAATLATYVPVRRATRVDPTTALRCE